MWDSLPNSLTDGMTALAEYNPLPVAIFDLDLRYRYANKASRMLIPVDPIGLTPTETILRLYKNNNRVVPEMYLTIMQEWEQKAKSVIQSRIPMNDEQIYDTQTGKLFYKYTLIPKLDFTGQVEFLISICQDLSPVYEANLRVANLEEIQQEQQATLSQLVHDQRNNLNNLYFTALAMTKQSFEKRMNYFRVMTSLIEQAKDISEDMSILSQQDKLTFDPEEIDFYELMENIYQTFANIHHTHHLIFEYKGERQCAVDSKLIRRILNNLISNAIKYSGVGSTIHIRTEALKQITLEVEDNGPGIDPEDQKHLFKMFFRGANTKDIHGYGIGLASTQACVTAHGGKISLKSTLGHGSRFTVCIPL